MTLLHRKCINNITAFKTDVHVKFFNFEIVESPVSSSELHGPSIFADKAKIYGVLYIRPSFEETSSYWSAPKSS